MLLFPNAQMPPFAAAASTAAATASAAVPAPRHHQQSVLGEDLKASDMEVGVVTASDGFKVLSASEVDAFLTIISERD